MFNTLVQVLKEKQNKVEEKGITFISGSDKEEFISYKNLYNQARYILYNLQSKGIKRKDSIILKIEDNKMFLKAFWACLLGGIIAVPISPGSTDENQKKALKILEITEYAYLLTDRKNSQYLEEYMKKNNYTKEILQEAEKNVIMIEEIDFMSKLGDVYDAKPDDLAFIQFSSGSTGDPKGVILTHEQIMTNVYDLSFAGEFTEEDSGLTWLPLTHDMGMFGCHLVPVVTGFSHCIMPTQLFIRKPTLWMKKINDHKITFTCSPNFGYHFFLRYFKPEDCVDWNLSNVRIIINGAEPISYKLMERFLNTMRKFDLKESTMFTGYGMAEAVVAVTCPPFGEGLVGNVVDGKTLKIGHKVTFLEDENHQNATVLVELGYPLRECSVRICDANNNVLNDDFVGFVQIKGKNVTKGYYKNKEATRKAIVGDGWLNTGDVGFLHNGRFTITGRAKDIIILQGQNLYPHDIEKVAIEMEDISLGEVAVSSVYNHEKGQEEIIVFVKYRKNIDKFIILANKIQKNIARKMGIKVEMIIPVKRIPKTTSGKIQRYKLAERFQNGEFDSLIKEINLLRKTKDNIEFSQITPTEKIILKICWEILGDDTIGLNDSLRDYGGTSIHVVQFHQKLEEFFSGKVTVSDLYSYISISDLAKQIENSEEISIEPIKLPQRYFEISSFGKNEGVFESYIESDIAKKFFTISKELGIEFVDVVAALFIQLLSQISGSKVVTIQTIFTAKNTVIPVGIDLNNINDLWILAKNINETIRKNKTFAYKLNQAKNFSLIKKKNEILPLICNRDLKVINQNIYSVYDIILEVDENEGNIDLVCFFNENRLKKDRVREMFLSYMKLLAHIGKMLSSSLEEEVTIL
ncbi:MAG: non-ribosomal peptide synthetase [Halanaerobiales bacterium]|nr:non-ribosomal peptide synthetase [Halanaerobiales bacterium]